MNSIQRLLSACLLGLLPLSGNAAVDAAALYKQHCAECHGPGRLGLVGPALLPQNLRRLGKKAAAEVIRDTRPASQMPAFRDKLNERQIAALVKLIYTPLKETPKWGMQAIRASQIVSHRPGELPDRPKFQADIDNLFMVVELGDHHATLLDGDSFEPIFRFPTRFAVHGGPKWSDGGRYIYFLSRDGWVSKFDVFNLTYAAEVRAGINSRNLAVSRDGRYVIVANYLPHTLTILDARDLSPLQVLEAQDEKGQSSRVSAVYTADPRGSFIAAMKDIPEVWEIGYRGDHTQGQLFPVRRIRVKGYLDDFFLTQDYNHIVGTSRGAKTNGQVVDLNTGRALAEVHLPGMPHLSSAITWPWHGHTLLATPNIKKPEVTLIDMDTWKVVKRIPTQGPGFFMRSHENTPYAWTDVFFGPHRDLMHVIDKRTLKIVKTLRPAPGKTSAHVEFTKDGRYALVSIWDMDGAIVVYDANTFKEIKRIPMKKPSGKYNVHNKLTRSRGTSH